MMSGAVEGRVRRGDTETRGRGDAETRGRGDTETRGPGDAGTRRRGDAGHAEQGHLSASPRSRVPASLRPRVPASLRRLTWLQVVVHIGALVPLAVLIWDATQNNLTVNPIQEITLRTGKTALVLLVLSLAATPINTVFGFRQALRVRRALGLYAFFYAALHFLIFVGLDYGFSLQLIWLELAEKRFVLVGFAAFLILLALAITSTKGWQRRLGKAWKRLHKLVYVAGLLVVFHFLWLVKSDIREPLAWGGVVLLLLVLRLSAVRRWVVTWRGRLARRLVA